jgi:DNA-binding protein H-NS
MAKKSEVEDLTVEELRAQAAEYVRLANEKESAAKTSLFDSCVEQLTAGGFTVDDLFKYVHPRTQVVATRRPRTPKDPNAPVVEKVKPAAKYRGPNGEEWSGRGSRLPQWVKDAKESGTLESYLIV